MFLQQLLERPAVQHPDGQPVVRHWRSCRRSGSRRGAPTDFLRAGAPHALTRAAVHVAARADRAAVARHLLRVRLRAGGARRAVQRGGVAPLVAIQATVTADGARATYVLRPYVALASALYCACCAQRLKDRDRAAVCGSVPPAGTASTEDEFDLSGLSGDHLPRDIDGGTGADLGGVALQLNEDWEAEEDRALERRRRRESADTAGSGSDAESLQLALGASATGSDAGRPPSQEDRREQDEPLGLSGSRGDGSRNAGRRGRRQQQQQDEEEHEERGGTPGSGSGSGSGYDIGSSHSISNSNSNSNSNSSAAAASWASEGKPSQQHLSSATAAGRPPVALLPMTMQRSPIAIGGGGGGGGRRPPLGHGQRRLPVAIAREASGAVGGRDDKQQAAGRAGREGAAAAAAAGRSRPKLEP